MSHVIVLGEYFIDRYYIGTADRLSPEAPIPVVKVNEVVDKPGGAGNVTTNLIALGATVSHPLPPGPLPIKNRLIAAGHQLARWDESDYTERYQLSSLQELADQFERTDAIIISDYNKGAFGPAVIELIGELAGRKQIYIDTKRSPVAYHLLNDRATFFPNLKEFYQFSDYTNCTRVLRKEGAEGMTYFLKGEPIWHEPTYAINPISVSGAGDTVIASFVMASLKPSLAGKSIKDIMNYSSKAAAIAIGKPLTSVATDYEIENFSTR